MRRLLVLGLLVLSGAGLARAGFGGYLKQSTATTILFGPIVDGTDGKTAEDSLTNHAAHIQLWKQGASAFAAKNDATANAHKARGQWLVTLDATDTNTRGNFRVDWADANDVLIIPQDYLILDPNEYNRMFSTGEVDVYSLSGSKAAADNAETVFATDFGSNYNATADRWKTDVTHWYSQAVPEPNVTGVPEVDATYIDGEAVDSATADTNDMKTALGQGLDDRNATATRFLYLDYLNNANLLALSLNNIRDKLTANEPNLAVYGLATGASGFAALKADTAAILTDTGTAGVLVDFDQVWTGHLIPWTTGWLFDLEARR